MTPIELEQALARARAQERERFLRELHDGLGSSLSAARIRLDDDSLTREQVGRLLDECIDDLRMLVATSAPDADLASALGDLRYRTDRQAQGAGPSMRWRFGLDGMPDVTSTALLALMRVVQEAVANALQHAGAGLVEVDAQYDAMSRRLQLRVNDDGCGFDTTHSAHGGRGLRNMRRRAAQVGAVLEIDSDGHGTRVALSWDLPATQDESAALGA